MTDEHQIKANTVHKMLDETVFEVLAPTDEFGPNGTTADDRIWLCRHREPLHQGLTLHLTAGYIRKYCVRVT